MKVQTIQQEAEKRRSKSMKKYYIIPVNQEDAEFVESIRVYNVKIYSEQLKEIQALAYKAGMERCLELLPEKKEVCGCEENESGYHTKECNLIPYGYNQALQEVEEKITEEARKI